MECGWIAKKILIINSLRFAYSYIWKKYNNGQNWTWVHMYDVLMYRNPYLGGKQTGIIRLYFMNNPHSFANCNNGTSIERIYFMRKEGSNIRRMNTLHVYKTLQISDCYGWSVNKCWMNIYRYLLYSSAEKISLTLASTRQNVTFKVYKNKIFFIGH